MTQIPVVLICIHSAFMAWRPPILLSESLLGGLMKECCLLQVASRAAHEHLVSLETFTIPRESWVCHPFQEVGGFIYWNWKMWYLPAGLKIQLGIYFFPLPKENDHLVAFFLPPRLVFGEYRAKSITSTCRQLWCFCQSKKIADTRGIFLFFCFLDDYAGCCLPEWGIG